MKRLKNINYKSVREFLVILLVAQSINATLFVGVAYSQAKIATWIYQNYTAPFLVQ